MLSKHSVGSVIGSLEGCWARRTSSCLKAVTSLTRSASSVARYRSMPMRYNDDHPRDAHPSPHRRRMVSRPSSRRFPAPRSARERSGCHRIRARLMSAALLILLQKSKIERRRKSRKSEFLAPPLQCCVAPMRSFRGRFCMKRCDAPYCRERKASEVLKNLVRLPKRTQRWAIGYSPRYLRINGIRCDHERWGVACRSLCAGRVENIIRAQARDAYSSLLHVTQCDIHHRSHQRVVERVVLRERGDVEVSENCREREID